MSVRIQDLRPGDRLTGGSAGVDATLISWSTPHPIHGDLFALVVWRISDGRLSLDALAADQLLDDANLRVVDQSEDQRMESLRIAIDPPLLRVDASVADAAAADVRERIDGLAGSAAVEVRHYIGVLGVGRLHSRCEAAAGGWKHGPHEPVPVGRYRTPPDEEGPLLFPVDEATAREFMGERFDDGRDDEREDLPCTT